MSLLSSRSALSALASLALFVPAAFADNEQHLSKVSLGEHWGGPRWSTEKLQGRVVVFEFWGYNCPPCRASIPHLQKLQEKYAGQGLVIIGTHVQNEPREKTLQLFKKLGGKYAVTSFGRVPWSNVSGIPRIFIFDHSGVQVFEGRPDPQFDKKLEETMARAPDWLVGDAKYAECGKEAADCAKRKNMGKHLAALEKKLEKEADGAFAKEAHALIERVGGYGRSLLDEAGELKYGDPIEADRLLNQVKAWFKGHVLADEAEEALKTLKKDKRYQQELAARGKLAKLDLLLKDLAPCSPDQPLDLGNCLKCQTKNGAALRGLLTLRGELRDKFEDSAALADFEATLQGLGIEG